MSTVKFVGGLVIAAIMGALLMFLTAYVYPMIAPKTGMYATFPGFDRGFFDFLAEIILPAAALAVSVRYYFVLTDGFDETGHVLLVLFGYWIAVLGVFLIVALAVESLLTSKVVDLNRYGEFAEVGLPLIAMFLPIMAATGVAFLAKMYFVAKGLDTQS